MAQTPPEEKKVPPEVVIEAYKQMLTSLFVGTLVALFLGFLALLPFLWNYFHKGETATSDVPLLATVMLTGALGAFFSALTRLYSFNELPNVLIQGGLKLPAPQLLMYSLIPPVVGAIAALMLYFTFAGHLITGELFPSISCHEPRINDHEGCVKLSSLLSTDGPDSAVAFAKVIVWSFIAGFAERLVPNTLDTLAKTMEKQEKQEKQEKEIEEKKD